MSDDRPAEKPDGAERADVLSYQAQPAQGVRWVSVWKPGNSFEANLAIAKLQEHGIHARVDMEHTAGLGLPYAALANTKIQVLAEDADAARALLLEIDRQRARRQEAMSLKCPKCAAPDPKPLVHPLRWVAWGMLGLLVALGALAAWGVEVIPFGWLLLLPVAWLVLLVWGVTPRWQCESCGHRWSAPEPEEVEEDDDDEHHEPDDDDHNDADPEDVKPRREHTD